jgi:hypothetical protein
MIEITIRVFLAVLIPYLVVEGAVFLYRRSGR